MKEQINQFLEFAEGNEELLEKLKVMVMDDKLDDVISLAKEYGFEFIQADTLKQGEMDEENLEMVSGGTSMGIGALENTLLQRLKDMFSGKKGSMDGELFSGGRDDGIKLC